MSILRQLGLIVLLVGFVSFVAAFYYWEAGAVVGSGEQTGAAGPPGADGPPGAGGPPTPAVTTAVVSRGTVSNRLEAVGSSEALNSVSVVPLVSGTVTAVAIDSGDRVKAGDPLVYLNAEAEQIARDQAAVDLKSSEDTLARYKNLSGANATSELELNTYQTERDTAELTLRDAEYDLQIRSSFAPIDGVVGIVPVEVGDFVTTETEIATIDDRSKVIVDFWAPERFLDEVAIGQPVKATSLALGGDVFEGELSEIGSRIETDSRTFQLRALIDNPEDRLRPGMSFEISMDFEGEPYPAVDPLAVQWDAQGSYVWVLDQDKVVRTPARIVQRDSGSVLIDGDIADDAEVVVAGLIGLQNGATVEVQEQVPPVDVIADRAR